MKTDELRRKYYCATNQHEAFENAYLKALEKAKAYFESSEFDKVQEELDFAKTMLEVAADAKEEMMEFSRMLKARKCAY